MCSCGDAIRHGCGRWAVGMRYLGLNGHWCDYCGVFFVIGKEVNGYGKAV